MNNISPSKFNSSVNRLKSFADSSGEISGFKFSDDSFVLYNPITQLFAISYVTSADNDNYFEFDGEILEEPYFSLDEFSLIKFYKEKYFSGFFNTGNDKFDSILAKVFTNDLILYFILILFMFSGTFISTLFKLAGGPAIFLCLFTFVIGIFFFSLTNDKKK